uniref:Uncharacterized protein n=1 Tax=Rhizophora mucronata TaxID=61149 RepID=A0A2P2NRB1_RHIMU
MKVSSMHAHPDPSKCRQFLLRSYLLTLSQLVSSLSFNPNPFELSEKTSNLSLSLQG